MIVIVIFKQGVHSAYGDFQWSPENSIQKYTPLARLIEGFHVTTQHLPLSVPKVIIQTKSALAAVRLDISWHSTKNNQTSSGFFVQGKVQGQLAHARAHVTIAPTLINKNCRPTAALVPCTAAGSFSSASIYQEEN